MIRQAEQTGDATVNRISIQCRLHNMSRQPRLAMSTLNKKDHLTDRKIFFDCFIKRLHKINKTKFEIKLQKKKKKEYRSFSLGPQTKICWNAVGIIWIGF